MSVKAIEQNLKHESMVGNKNDKQLFCEIITWFKNRIYAYTNFPMPKKCIATGIQKTVIIYWK